MKNNIKNISYDDLVSFLASINQPKFRALQIYEWLFKYRVKSFDEMTNLPKKLISKLSSIFVIPYLSCYGKYVSKDGTIKYILQSKNREKNNDNVFIETVLIPSFNNKRNTICISTQVGCAMACSFCATGKQGFKRNLDFWEIIDQVLFVNNDLNISSTNIVVMGQGEPFLNYDNLLYALEIINNPKFIGIGARKITVSTCGIINAINKFSKIEHQYGLAISLHSAIQSKRNKIMPGLKGYTLENLHKSLSNYIAITNRRPTLEYLMLHNVNDGEEDLNALINFCDNLKCHINLIKYNKTDKSSFEASKRSKMIDWMNKISKAGINVSIRESGGTDISAACGQLLNSLNI